MRRIDSTDRIQMMSDDELIAKFRASRAAAVRGENENYCDYEAEIDNCYYHRELEIRDQRREAHQRWLASRVSNRSDTSMRRRA